MADPTQPAQESAADPSLEVERRIIVKGWKMESGQRREFADYSRLYDWSSVEYQRKRIGEIVLEWQPHITEIVVEERIVTPWRQTFVEPEGQPNG